MSWQRLSCLVSVVAVFLATEAAASPASLRLTVSPDGALAPGRTASVRVAFADAAGAACANDQRRRVTLSLSGSAGRLDRDHVDIEAGQGLSEPATFTATSRGDVFITARSPGLAAAQVVVAVRPSPATGLLRFFEEAVFADSEVGFTLLSLPLNATDGQGGSWESGGEALLGASLDDTQDVPRHPTLEVWTEPGEWSIAVGEAPFGLGPQRATLSQVVTPIKVYGRPDSGDVCVLARIVENGDRKRPQRQCLRFTKPVAWRIALEPQLHHALASETELALTLRLLDQFDLDIGPVTRPHNIEIISSHAAARLESKTPCPPPAGVAPAGPGPCLTLLPGATRGRATLKWSGLSAGTTLQLTARDLDDTVDLRDGTAEVVIAARPFALALLAALGGCLGGLARLFYLGVALEGRRRYRLDLRGATHLAFSAVFGLTLFEAADVGLTSIPSLASATGVGLTFVIGTVGGYGGVLVLARLLDRFLPGPHAVGGDAAHETPRLLPALSQHERERPASRSSHATGL